MKNMDFRNTAIKDGFWRYYHDLVREVTVHAVADRFEETHRFAAFACDWRPGDDEEKRPHVFWDSDIAKWIEGTAYLLEEERDAALEAKIDWVADQIEKNQRNDGYYNSHFLTVEPEAVFTNRGAHELYCTGHMVEAAIAYHHATGKDKLLRCMLKNVDCIYRVFVEQGSASFVTPGHEEIEIALIKLYAYTGEKKHLELARFFVDKRGNNDLDDRSDYTQSNTPARDIKEAVGHSVRALYFYTAMAMLAKECADEELNCACHRLIEDITCRKMSITGGVGAEKAGERFSYPYDLPNANTYNETCAAIALAMFAGEMQEADPKGIYGDIVERVLYNGFLSGISLSGDHFFYTNPQEIDLKKNSRESEWNPIPQRVKVFSCSCCPPNVVRMLASIQRYTYSIDGSTLYCHQFMDSVTSFTVEGEPATLTQKTDYPVSGRVEFTYRGKPITLKVRIPGWCCEYQGEVKDGFATVRLNDADTWVLDLPMNIHFMEANPSSQDNSGRYAVMRGPVVYCMEGIDNGANLRDITLIENAPTAVKTEEDIPAPVLYMSAERRDNTPELYRLKNNIRTAFTAKLIPYFAFANRAATDMLVWTQVR